MERQRARPATLILLLVATLLLGGCSVRSPDGGEDAGSGAAGAATEGTAVPEDAGLGDALAYQDGISSAVGGVEFPEANPFAYQNPWR